MFDNLKAMAGLAGLVKDLPRIKEKIEAVKAGLGDKTVTGETGGGAVRVTANGLLRVVAVEVDQVLVAGLVDSSSAEDKSMAEDLIAGAVNAALTKAREMAEQEMAAVAGELGIPLPPGGLGGMLG